MPCDRDTPWLGLVLELAMTPLCCDEEPTLFLDELDDIADLHLGWGEQLPSF